MQLPYSPSFARRTTLFLRLLATAAFAIASSAAAVPLPTTAALDAEVARAMEATGARGLAIAVIDDGRVQQVRAYGQRNERGDPLQTDTVMYGASLTKAVFGYTVMRLVDEGVLDLDRPIAERLAKPLPDYPDEEKYAPWSGLAGDERWRQLTPRMLLTHSAGFSNFAFLEPDGRLRIHFEPGTRYAYSGEGLILLQFVLERGLGIDLGEATQRRVFDRFAMPNSGLRWRPDFARNLADGWRADGSVEPHDERGRVRVSGSMDTTIADFANFAAAYVRGDGLSTRSRAELVKPQLPITTASQFPTLQAELPLAQRYPQLAAGLGVVVFDGPQGRGFMKGGHNDSTGNTLVCLEQRRRCVAILANDVRAEAAFPALVHFVLGETGAPWRWEYGDMPFWTPSPRQQGEK
ncbi:CubicO group peptidase (beta-lactamase class C family) [Tahibacter aquaticus]|uniref:CubicO group peptidase (Beta-lactamase class C family) n=1 Tax=Tahibacter aquaticus TaxID=520092 RepID=A0A4R6YW52_9GAMM|nr:serine hydrolase domain-containing protein [Tahibacter aquaticus]TDR43050.1 CubicO group peptidase (beta-lactamase class C family) [Tahibacter aquaticus]